MVSPAGRIRRGIIGRIAEANLATIIFDGVNATSSVLPLWNDSAGTVLLDDNDSTVRAMSWTPTGYTLVENGAVIEQYPYPWEDPPQTGGGTTYYFSWSEGDGANDGLSTANPMKDLDDLGFGVAAGDTLLLKRGDTFPAASLVDTLRPSRSGTSSNYIKIGAYGSGAKPIIDGEDTEHYCLRTNGKNYLWYDNLDFRRGGANWPTTDYEGMVDATSSSSRGIVLTNCVIRESSGTGLSLKPWDSRVYNCIIHDNVGWGMRYGGTSEQTASGCEIINCEFYGNASASDPNGSTGTESMYGLARDMRLAGCYFHDNETTDHEAYRGWNLDQDSDAWQGAVRIHDNIFDNYGNTYKTFAAIGSKGRGSRIYRNKVFVTGRHGFGASIAFAADAGTPYNVTYSHHNIVTDVDESAGFSGGAGMFIGSLSSQDANGRGELNAHNNTLDENFKGFRVWSQDLDTGGTGGTDSNYLRTLNNLITNASVEGNRNELAIYAIEYDYNYYYAYQDTFHHLGTDYDFAGWQGLGFDANGVDGTDPLYVSGSDTDPNDRDYGLQSSSPARGVGTDAVFEVENDPSTWIGINYVPHATSPDAGAYQYLSGKTLDFSKYFLGLACASDTAAAIKVWNYARDSADLITDTT